MATTHTDIPRQITPAQRRLFAGLLPVFFVLLGVAAIRHRQYTLFALAMVSSVAVVGVILATSKNRSQKVAGLSLPLLFVLLAALPLRSANPRAILVAFGAFGLLLGLIALSSPRCGNAIYAIINLATEPMGQAISFCVLAALFYLVFTPLGVCMRILGRDVLGQILNRQASSYWVARQPPEPNLERYFDQF